FLSALARQKLVQPVVRDHVDWQREVNAALFSALWELSGAVSAKTSSGGVPLVDLNARLWDAVRLQGERINRLEADLWEALRRGAGSELPPGGDDRPR
ncbi:MAG TPA: hypothetical protein VNT52_13350, partial [Acidimicrobiales bacterium]|nr:hypothetical protein [Acidimicrobiales bacterium]